MHGPSELLVYGLEHVFTLACEIRRQNSGPALINKSDELDRTFLRGVLLLLTIVQIRREDIETAEIQDQSQALEKAALDSQLADLWGLTLRAQSEMLSQLSREEGDSSRDAKQELTGPTSYVHAVMTVAREQAEAGHWAWHMLPTEENTSLFNAMIDKSGLEEFMWVRLHEEEQSKREIFGLGVAQAASATSFPFLGSSDDEFTARWEYTKRLVGSCVQ